MHQLDRIEEQLLKLEEKLDKVVSYFESKSVGSAEETEASTWPGGLSESQVKAIQKDHKTGRFKQEELADMYDVSQSTISRVCNNVTLERRRNS